MYFQDAGRPEWECVSQVELGLGDVNDNRPMWDQEEFLTNVPEDAVVGGIVTNLMTACVAGRCIFFCYFIIITLC